LTTILPDPPNAKAGMAMLARQCDACSGLPFQVRANRLFKIMKAMFPGWRPRGRAWNRR
jgi:hypothetical protein